MPVRRPLQLAIAYGATLRDWPLALTAIDMAWGSALSVFSATAGYLAASRPGR